MFSVLRQATCLEARTRHGAKFRERDAHHSQKRTKSMAVHRRQRHGFRAKSVQTRAPAPFYPALTGPIMVKALLRFAASNGRLVTLSRELNATEVQTEISALTYWHIHRYV